MTCVVAVIEDGVATFACDSLLSDDDGSASITNRPKLELVGSALVAWSGSLGHAQHAMAFVRGFDLSSESLLDGSFVAGLREHCSKFDKDFSASLLIAVDGALFEVDSGFGVTEPACKFGALGSGSAVALGALHALDSSPVVMRLHRALEASEAMTTGVRRPWHFRAVRCEASH